uniref:Chromosome 20 open reading frame 173 n=1 Tax=Phocoena sinus TaxID=42100 RepID=A0A8C9C0C6_PHOSS
MKCCWQIFVLCISLMLILWLMAPCLDLEPESALHKWMKVVPWRCSCPPFKFRKYGCPSRTLNDSVCHHTARGNWFDVGYEKTMGHLIRAAEPTSPDAVLSWSGMNSASELGRVWEKLFKVIPRTSVSHFDLFCGTCASVGNSKILWAASLGKSSYHTAVSRNGRDQGSWRQLDLLLLKLFVLAWTSDAMSEEILEDGPVP